MSAPHQSPSEATGLTLGGHLSGPCAQVTAADFRAHPVVLEGLWPEASASFIWAFGRHVSKAEQSERVTPKEITDSIICCQ